jgi:murein DD-endopeptidase MepM/ murein hydrolase activator NlpD
MASAGPAMAGWSITGGSPVTVAPGESAHVLSQRYGVPVEALVQTNGFATASQIQPGARIIIPVYNAALAASTGARVSTVEPKPTHLDQVPAKTMQARAQTERTTIAKMEEKPNRTEEKAKVVKKGPGAPPANLVAPKTVVTGASKAQVAQQTVAPTGKHNEMKASASKDVVAKPIAQQEKPIAAAKPPNKGPDSRLQEAKVQEAPKAEQVPANTPADADKPSDSANPEFRWPARGRIIQGFKAGGNDGINIAVPEGTAVKAAEGGIVAYAGSELKGYGNLVLIKHPNGFVTAYANNGDLEVKRGETVKRGQTIAKSGQSGNVASPQLHFELRKGATPVDPTQYLAGL